MIRKLAAKFPNSRFTATDAVDGPLDSARRAAEDEGLTNITFRIVDACDSPEDWNEQFDWIFAIMVIHDLPHPRRALAAVKKALKPGGVFSMLDECVSSHLAENIGNGHATFMYTISTFHCIPESFQQDDSEAVGACWGEQLARRMIDEAGLKLLNVHKGEEVGSSAIFTCQKLPE